MTWAKLDDKILMHPKMRKARRLGGDSAFAAWAGALAYTSQFDLDGFVPADIVPDLCSAPKKSIEALVASGLWEEAEGGFQIHDWAELNLTREERDAKREAGNERLKKSRDKKRERTRAATPGDTQVKRVSPTHETPVSVGDTGMSATETATDPIHTDPIRSEAAARTAATGSCEQPPKAPLPGPKELAVLEALRRWPVLAPLATIDWVRGVLLTAATAGWSLADIEAGIAEFGEKRNTSAAISGSPEPGKLSDALTGFVKSSHLRHRSGGQAPAVGQRGAPPQAQESHHTNRVTDEEKAEILETQRELAEKAARAEARPT